jgi:hypothetical protein
VIGYPPLFGGAFQYRLICVGETAVAISPVGAPGAVPVDDDVGVADTSDDAMLVPTEFIA